MFFGVSHLDVPVQSLVRALSFYEGTLGFPRRKAGEGWVDLDAGSVVLRLVEVLHPEYRPTLRVQVRDVAAAAKALVEVGARLVQEPVRTPELELVASLRDPDDNQVVVWRDLTEDEYDFVPELPTSTRWGVEAEVLLKGLLQHVPALFRGLARRKVTKLVEELAGETADRIVTSELVVRGYILSSAKITRYRLHAPLLAHGYDPERYRADFEG